MGRYKDEPKRGLLLPQQRQFIRWRRSPGNPEAEQRAEVSMPLLPKQRSGNQGGEYRLPRLRRTDVAGDKSVKNSGGAGKAPPLILIYTIQNSLSETHGIEDDVVIRRRELQQT